MVVFQLNTVGTYKFHCGNSPTKDIDYGTIYVTEGGSTAVSDIANNPISVYPNPATDVLTIKGLNGAAEVFDVNGKKVMNVMSGTFDISTLSNGTYIVKSEKFNTLFIEE